MRGKSIQGSYEKIALKDLLAKVIEGTDIVLSDSIAEIELSNIVIDEQPVLNFVNYLKTHCYLSVFFIKNVLYCHLEFLTKGKEVKHRIGWNVIKDNDLKLRTKQEVNVQVNLTAEKPDGTKVKASSGKREARLLIV